MGSRFGSGRAYWRWLLALSAVGPLLFPFVAARTALADCCACTGNDPTKKLCITINHGACGTIKKDYTNPALGSVTCDGASLTDSQCKLINDPAGGGLCNQITDADAYGTAAGSDSDAAKLLNQPPLVAPNLEIPIPGLTFTSAPNVTNGQLQVPFLAQYISAVYRYLVGITVIAAAIMIVYGGVLYVVGSSMSSITSGKEIIKDALIGLILVFGTYTIIYTLIGQTGTNLKSVALTIVKAEYLEQEKVLDPSVTPGSGAATVAAGSGTFRPATDDERNNATVIQAGSDAAPQPLNVSVFKQYAAPWGVKAYGPEGVKECPGVTSASYDSVQCCTIFARSGCGPTSLATLFTFNGADTDPLKMGYFLSSIKGRICNSGTFIDAKAINAHTTDGMTVTDLGHGKTGVKNAVSSLRHGQPVMFLCSGCSGTTKDGNAKSYTGHYMVLTGVDPEGIIFTVGDVGNPDPKGIVNIAQDQLALFVTSFWTVKKK